MPVQVLCQLLALADQVWRRRLPDIREHVSHRGELLALSNSQRRHHLLPGKLAQRLILLVVPSTRFLEQQLGATNRFQPRPRHVFHLIGIAIFRCVVRGAVMPTTVSHQFYQHRLSSINARFASFFRRQIHRREVVAIDANRIHAVRDAPCGNAVAGILLLCRRRDGPAVVAADENGLCLQGRREVQRHSEVALRGCAIPEIGHAAARLSTNPKSIACTNRLRDLRA
mmetsp:Transcript_76443/g.137936  ORF Transcript_76443/g.137936 Transcript_76443/m.137936 type:complete len:227 (-) Transcript_76443:16-696(-)